VAYYEGKPSPDEKPFDAFARALGYADQSELKRVLAAPDRDLADELRSILAWNKHGPNPLAKDRARATFDLEDHYRDLSDRLYKAEERVLTRFGIHTPSLKNSDLKRLLKTFVRMYVGLPPSYRDQLQMVLRRVDNLAFMRIHSADVGPYIRCFA
jgi:hypothetical protein